MNKNYPFSEIKSKLDGSQKILVALPIKPGYDQVAAALALTLSLEELGKNVSIVAAAPMTVEFNHLVGVNKVSTKVQGTDLVISFNYPVEMIEKVSYNDDNGRPNVVVQPKPGAPPLSENLATFSFLGVAADLIFAVGIKNQEQLDMGQDLAGSYIMNIDNDSFNTNFGQLNLVDPQSSSVSEMVLGIISGLGLNLSVDIAQNLLEGVWRRTRGLTADNLSPDSYEAVAVCLRAGAKKPLESVKKEGVFTPPNPPINPPKPPAPVKPPADWFEPKIYRGTNIS